jgi:valyl-tRNA synthetase
MLFVFESALRLLHPFMPFITEELWQSIPHNGESIVIAPYPEMESDPRDEKSESEMEIVQDIITKVRNIRSEMNVDSKQTVTLRIAAHPRMQALLQESDEYIRKLAQVSEVTIGAISGDKMSAQAVAAGCAIEVPLAGVIDLGAERMRLTKLLEKAIKDKALIENQLSKSDFRERAPQEVVQEKNRLRLELDDQIVKLTAGIDRLH